MPKAPPLFGLRFDSDADLNPTAQDLRVFLDTVVRDGAAKPHRSDLERYRGLIEDLGAFLQGPRPDGVPRDAREELFYAVLGHTQFAAPGLELAVGQYKYHLHALAALDPVKPAAFIRTAEAELGKLNPKKKNEAAKHARLLGMLEERKRALGTLTVRRRALTGELRRIAGYIRENLARIEELCEASIVVLADPAIIRREQARLVGEIRERTKERLRDSLHAGRISRQDLETARQEVDVLAGEITSLVRDDIYAAAKLYEAVHDHVQEHIRRIDRLLAGIAEAADGDSGKRKDLDPFVQLERVLVSLVSSYRFELKAPAVRSRTGQDEDLREARKEFVSTLVGLLNRERRASSDRRSGEDRRISRESHIRYSEKRSGKDRRTGKNRRKAATT